MRRKDRFSHLLRVTGLLRSRVPRPPQPSKVLQTRPAIVRLLPLVAWAAILLPVAAEAQQTLVERGRQLASRECAGCHAVSRTGESPHAKAPAFRLLPQRYPVAHLAESLVEGIVVGHGDMPEFLFEPDDVEALLAYIASLDSRPR